MQIDKDTLLPYASIHEPGLIIGVMLIRILSQDSINHEWLGVPMVLKGMRCKIAAQPF
jgi:hypothetical protein